MATTKAKASSPETVDEIPMSIYEKLARIRNDFANATVKKSGKNVHAEFLYYELPDIVPIATEIIEKYKCMFICNFPSARAEGRLIDLEGSKEILFEFDTRSIAEPAKFRMNEAQALGAEMTYYRRYLYFLLLNITNKDEFDGKGEKAVTTGCVATTRTETKPIKTVEKSKPVGNAPATKEQRDQIKDELTNVEGPADKLQIKALKSVLKKLKELDPTQEEFIQAIAVKTEGFSDITKEKCENLILAVNEILEGYDE